MVGNANVIGGVAGLAALVVALLALWPRRTDADPLATVEYLAAETLRYWEVQAKARRITTPSPAAVSWRWAGPDIAVPATEMQPKLLTKGVVTELRRQLYRRLRQPARIVILGGPGAGKTSGMLLLLLDILRERERGSSEPVPVWLTLGGWNPHTTSLMRWAADSLCQTYRALESSQHGGPGTAEELIRSGHLALFLDGLDEMPAGLRAAALRQLDRDAAGLRLVMTSRSDEFREAISEQRLWTTAVIDVRPVEPAVAKKFLTAEQLGPQRDAWADVAQTLVTDPGGVVARTLTSPLALTLAREAYSGGNPRDLADRPGFATSEDLMRHLLGKSLELAYPDEAERRRAVGWLSWMAQELGGDRDLRWWSIPSWDRLSLSITAVTGGLIVGAIVGGGCALAWGALAGVVGGSITGLGTAIAIALSNGVAPHGVEAIPEDVREVASGRFNWLLLLVLAMAVFGIPAAIAMGPIFGLIVWMSVVFVTGAIIFVAQVGSEPAQPTMGPFDSFRRARRRSVVDLVVGILWGTLLGLVSECPGAGVGALIQLVSGVDHFAVTTSAFVVTSAAGFGWGLRLNVNASLLLQLHQIGWLLRGRPIRFMRFLETALDRQVLRQAGPVFQFRHALLQDYLASLESLPGAGRVIPRAVPPSAPSSRGGR